MAKMLRSTPNARSTYSDTCSCRQCRRHGVPDDMVRRQQRAREREEFRREVNRMTQEYR